MSINPPQNANPKSSLMWNVIDPGDPYDIKKSMIARLPQHNCNFMGNHLQMVCMMQAAQIERLSEYLSQFKIRDRQQQRDWLDKHSYEEQIKELSEKASQKSKDSEQLRIENEKLKQYIKRLTAEMDDLRNKTNIPQSLKNEYEQLFRKYQIALEQIQSSRQTTSTYQLQIAQLKQTVTEYSVKNEKLQKQYLIQLAHQKETFEARIREQVQIGNKQGEHKFGKIIYSLQSENRVYKEQMETKNLQITSLKGQNERLLRDIELKEQHFRDNDHVWENKTRELKIINETLSKKGTDLEKIYESYEKMELKLKEASRELYKYQQQNRFLHNQLERMRGQNSRSIQNISTIEDQEAKLALLSSQIERLSFLLSSKNQEIQEINKSLSSVKNDSRELTEKIKRYEIIISEKDRLHHGFENDRNNFEFKLRKQVQIGEQYKRDFDKQKFNFNQLKASYQNLEQLNKRLTVEINEARREIEKFTFDIQKGSIITRNQVDAQIKEITLRIRSENQIYLKRITQENILLDSSKNQLLQNNKILQLEVSNLQQKLVRKQREVHDISIEFQHNYRVQFTDISNRLKLFEEENQRLKNDKIKIKNALSEAEREVILRQKQSIEATKNVSSQNEELAAINEQIRKQNSRLRQQIDQNSDNLRRIQRQAEEKTATNHNSQIQNQKNIISSLENQLKSAKEDLKSIQLKSESSNDAIKNYKERLLMTSEQMERLTEILQKKNDQVEVLNNKILHGDYGLKSQLMEKQNIINNLKLRIETLQINLQSIISQRGHQQTETKSLYQKLQLLESTAKKQISDKEEQLRTMRIKLEEMDPTFRRQVQQKDNQINKLRLDITRVQEKYNIIISQKDNQIFTLTNNLDNVEERFRRSLREKQDQNLVMIERLNRVTTDNDQAERRIRNEYSNEIQVVIENQRRKYMEQQNNFNHENQALRNELNLMKNQWEGRNNSTKEIQHQLVIITRQRQGYIHTVNQLESTISQLRTSLQVAIGNLQKKQIEVKNISQVLRQLEDINNHTTAQRDHLFAVAHQYKEKLDQLNSNSSAVTQITGKYNEAIILCQQYQEQTRILQSSNQSLTKKIRDYQAKLNQSIFEVDRLNKILKDRESSIGMLSQLRQQLSNLHSQYLIAQQSSKEWQNKYIQLYQTYQSQTKISRSKIQEYELKLMELDRQFQNLNVNLMQTLKLENQSLRDENYDLIQKNKFLSSEIDRLNQIIKEIRKDLQDITLRLTDQVALQKRIQQYMALMVILFVEIQTLRSRVSETEKECENVRRSSLTPHRIDRQVGRSIDQPRRMYG